MPKEPLPVYQIQDFHAQAGKEPFFYVSPFAAHLQEHLFIREPHKHDFYILLLITSGTGTHTIDFKRYEVCPNTVFFMVPGQVHSWELSDDTDGVVVFFASEFYLNEFPHRKLYRFPFFNALLHKPVLPVSPEARPVLERTFLALQSEYLHREIMRTEMLGCYLDVLLIQLTRHYERMGAEPAVRSGELSLLQNLEHLIGQHFTEHQPVTFYADRLHVTAKHLKEACKRSLGKTTARLLQERLVLEAKRLLIHSELNSSQIAAALGYTDTSYFFRFFRKQTGSTPEHFRSVHAGNPGAGS